MSKKGNRVRLEVGSNQRPLPSFYHIIKQKRNWCLSEIHDTCYQAKLIRKVIVYLRVLCPEESQDMKRNLI